MAGSEKKKAEELGVVPGATVQLKSGGPLMTVTRIGDGRTTEGVIDLTGHNNDGMVRATWFDGNKEKAGFFPYITLEVIG